MRILIIDRLRSEETFLRYALRSDKRFDLYEVILQPDAAIPPTSASSSTSTAGPTT